ncbi:uncharacterized protein LOC123672804 [Harmonia axyridis]|uniref:uncharacterized protein LOC123672804 n=1 Tax=Harmonia axyridis TaxID=115357 RepID=UPI001E276478|nr:uncharacterized protein LOC123672804 [Harmonia axyridis]
MPKVERKEYQETKILKTVSPVRSQSSQNLSQFDSNLDYLLDDLQNSVSRPGSSLAVNNEYDNYRTNGFNSHKTNSLNRVLRVNAANPVTEYSSDDAYSYKSPDGSKRIEGYKKESYSYRTTGGGNDVRPEKVRVQNSINQLDSLLDDLKEAKKTPLMERDIYGNYVDTPTLGERNEKYSTSTVKRELHYGDTPQTQRSSTLNRRIEKEQMVSRDNEYRTNEGYYNHTTSSSPPSRSSTLSRQMKVKNVHTSPVEVVQTTCPEINPEILEHLDPALRPPENTKVTTTIKTYTYEIPGTLDYRNTSDVSMDSKKYVYSPNDSQSTPSKSFVYEKLENIENKRTVVQPEINYETRVLKESTVDNYKPYKKPNPPGYDGNVTETITTRNYQPGYPRSNNEYVYNETVTTKNIDNGYPIAPPQKKTYIVEETIDERNYIDNYPVRDPPPQKTYVLEKTVNERNYVNDYPVRDPPRKETYVYKETHNTFNKEYPNQPREPRDYIDRDTTRVSVRETNVNRINEPPYRNDYQPPQQPINIKYKYTTTSSTTNNYKTGYPPNEEGELLLPRPFPTEERVDGPPKKLDELMNTIGREPPTSPLNSGYQQHELELINERKAKALKQQATEVEDLQKAEPLVKSKNVNGPPVYYPPGHEMFAKKEEGAAAWRAQGAYARESGKYEYEAESKSKSKSSSGAAIVPVCLPLCCGLPCTII